MPFSHIAPGAGAHGLDIEHARIVKVDGHLVQLGGRQGQAAELVVAQAAGAHVAAVDVALGAEHALQQALAAHLKAVDEGWGLAVEGRVAHQVEAEGRLAHAGAGGHDDQLALLQAAGDAVQVGEAGVQAGEPALAAAQVVDALDGGAQLVLEGHHRAGAALAAHLEDAVLGLVEHQLGLLLLAVALAQDVAGGADEAAQQRLAAHDGGVVLGVGGRGDPVGELAQVGVAARAGQLAPLA